MRRYPFRSIIDEIERMRRELNRMLEEVFSEYPEEVEGGYLEPMMDIYEDDENFIITMEVPGVEKDEIRIEGYEDYLELTFSTTKVGRFWVCQLRLHPTQFGLCQGSPYCGRIAHGPLAGTSFPYFSLEPYSSLRTSRPHTSNPLETLILSNSYLNLTRSIPHLKKWAFSPKSCKMAKREEMKEMEDKNVVRRERKYSGFYRKIKLPSEVDVSKAKASYKNGILEIRIPKIKKKKSFEIKIE
ncbi:MAG: Hsp20/alpha crystallin family protein [Candidatus Asgardarchaeia archaeon]